MVYHGGDDDRRIQEAIAEMYLTVVPGLQWVAPHCEGKSGGSMGVEKTGGEGVVKVREQGREGGEGESYL